MASKYIQKYPIPGDFPEVLHDFVRELLRDQPTDIFDYGANYFRDLDERKKREEENEEEDGYFDYKQKGRNIPPDRDSEPTCGNIHQMTEGTLDWDMQEQRQKIFDSKKNYTKPSEEAYEAGDAFANVVRQAKPEPEVKQEVSQPQPTEEEPVEAPKPADDNEGEQERVEEPEADDKPAEDQKPEDDGQAEFDEAKAIVDKATQDAEAETVAQAIVDKAAADEVAAVAQAVIDKEAADQVTADAEAKAKADAKAEADKVAAEAEVNKVAADAQAAADAAAKDEKVDGKPADEKPAEEVTGNADAEEIERLLNVPGGMRPDAPAKPEDPANLPD